MILPCGLFKVVPDEMISFFSSKAIYTRFGESEHSLSVFDTSGLKRGIWTQSKLDFVFYMCVFVCIFVFEDSCSTIKMFQNLFIIVVVLIINILIVTNATFKGQHLCLYGVIVRLTCTSVMAPFIFKGLYRFGNKTCSQIDDMFFKDISAFPAGQHAVMV